MLFSFVLFDQKSSDLAASQHGGNDAAVVHHARYMRDWDTRNNRSTLLARQHLKMAEPGTNEQPHRYSN